MRLTAFVITCLMTHALQSLRERAILSWKKSDMELTGAQPGLSLT